MNIYIVQQTTGLRPDKIAYNRNKLIELCKKRYVGADNINILNMYQEVPGHPTRDGDMFYGLGSSLLILYLADVVVFSADYKRDVNAIILESVCKKHLMPCLYANDDITQLIKADENINNCSTDCLTEKPIEKVLTKADLVKTREIFNHDFLCEGYAYFITKNDGDFGIIITKFDDHALNYVYVTKDNGTCLNGVILVDQVISGDVEISKSFIIGHLGRDDVLKTIEYIDETAVEIGATYLVEYDYGSNHHVFTERLDHVSTDNSNALVFGDSNNVKCVFVSDISDEKNNFRMRKVD